MKQITLFFALAIFTTALFAQKNNVLMTVGTKKITDEEFSYIYKKNNSDNLNEKSLNEYLELFKNFKLKVIEAESLKMDTSKAFVNELSGYRKQLAKPYLTEEKKIEELVKEAYERSKKELKLDIIFIKVSKNASSEDTTLAYDKAIKIKDRIKQGESFETVAMGTSDDRAVAKNKGHLNFLPALKIPYSIQNEIFKLKKGMLSNPIRTNYGYYLVKLVDTRNAQGFCKVAHIMISATDNLKDAEKKAKKAKADSIYARILAGDKFEDLVKFSDDKGTAKKAGELPEFSTGRMVPEFETAAFNLTKVGEISKPIKTTFGWHIIKLISKREPESFEKQKDKLTKTVENDSERKEIIKLYVTDKLKKEYDFKQEKSPEFFYSIIDSTIYQGKWKMPKLKRPDNILFSILGKAYYESNFANFIETKQKRMAKVEIKSLVDNMYKDFIYESLAEVEQSKLEDNNNEFKYLMQEYHDGMLLFDLMKKEIWDKASEDSVGLKNYYENNTSKYDNQLDVDISVFKYDDEKSLKLAKKFLNKSRKKYNDEKLLNAVSKKGGKIDTIDGGFFSKGENIYADKVLKMKENNGLKQNEKFVNLPKDNVLIYINGTKKSKSKSFNEIKGIVISDYQNYIEKKWLEDLRKKYKINVNNAVLNKIKSSLK